MKILFYNHTGQVSGAEQVMLMILAGLDRNRFQPQVICPAEGALSQMAQDLKVPVTNIELLRARFTWRPDQLLEYIKSFFQVFIQLRKMVEADNPEIIHANTIRAGLVATTATLGMGVPVIWHLHDILPRHPLSTVIRWYATLSSRTWPLAVSRAVAWRFRGDVLRSLNAFTKTRVIHNGINLKRFKIESAARQKVRAEFELDEKRFVIGIVGQVTARKGQLGLIKAFAEALPQIPSAVLLVVGAPIFNQDHKYLLDLKRAAAELGLVDQVKFVGSRTDVPAVMQALDLLVLNSKVEPFSLVLLEAMACGTPILATAVGGVPELVAHKESGWLVPPDNKIELAQSLATLGNDKALRIELARKAFDEVIPRFSHEKYQRSMESFYLATQVRAMGQQERGLITEITEDSISVS